MLLASIHFGLIYMTVVTRSLRPLKNPVLRFYLLSLSVIIILTSISLKYHGTVSSWGQAFLDGSFQVVSYASTTGFAITDNATWPVLPCFLLVLVSLICGCAGSTTGGIKVDRMLVLFKAIRMQNQKILSPSSLFEVRMGNRILHDEDIYPHVLYISMFFLLIGLSAILCMVLGDPNNHALTGSIAMLSNVGPSLGSIGSLGNYNMEPTWMKIIFSLDMFLGRVEIYPVLAVMAAVFKRK